MLLQSLKFVFRFVVAFVNILSYLCCTITYVQCCYCKSIISSIVLYFICICSSRKEQHLPITGG